MTRVLTRLELPVYADERMSDVGSGSDPQALPRWCNQFAREVLATFPGHARLCHGEPAGGFVDESSVDEFREFVVTRWQALVRTAYLLVGDQGLAEDLVQTALERVHRRWERVERRDQPEVYARRVLINLAISWRRRRRVHEIPVAAVADASASSDVEPPDFGDAVWTAVRRLPPRMRAVIVLRYVEDRSEAEAADLLGCSVGTVKSAASRGLARIRDHLQAAHAGTVRSDGSRVDASPRPADASRIEADPTGRPAHVAASTASGASSHASFGRRYS